MSLRTFYIKIIGIVLLFGANVATHANVQSFCVSMQMQQPYQFLEIIDGMRIYKGLDIKLIQKIYNPIGVYLKYRNQSWLDGLAALKEGTCDILLNAFKTPEREQDYYFSEPYRQARDKLFTRSDEHLNFDSFEQLLKSPQLAELKLGVVKGYRYTSDALNDYLASPLYPQNIVYADSEKQSVENLLSGTVDGFFADLNSMDLLLWKNQISDLVQVASMDLGQKDIHVMFSKKRFNAQQVEHFNQRLDSFTKTRQYHELVRRNIVPLFISMTTDTTWYHCLEILGTMFYAISGLLLARQAQFSFSGAFILAMLPGIGGGVIRDVLLDRVPVGVFRTPIYFLTVVATVSIGFVLIRLVYYLYPIKRFYHFFNWVKAHYHARLSTVIRATDSIGLAAFTVIGVMVAVEMQASPLWLWGPILAVLSSTGGGIVRDFVMGVGLNRTYFYETSFLWGMFLSSYIIARTAAITSTEIFYAILITITGIITTRLIVIKNDWQAKDYWLLRNVKLKPASAS